MKNHYDLVVIGDGPAGMAAAIIAEKNGLSVLVLGETQGPGGQIYRNTRRMDPVLVEVLGPDYAKGKDLIREFLKARVDYLPDGAVWYVQPESEWIVSYISHRGARQLRSKRIILATGARERPIAIPGWTLPGVMAATAAEILLKSNGIMPQGKTVLAGSGPLLLLVATHLVSVGANIQAVLDTTPFRNYLDSIKYFPKALLAYKDLYKGIQMQQKIQKSSIPIFRYVKDLQALGSNSVEFVRFQSAGRTLKVNTDILLLHNGLVPDTQMSFLLDCDHEWYDVQRYWRPTVDHWGNTSIHGVGVAGDAAGIGGADAAVILGSLAGLEATFSLKMISAQERDRKARPLQKKLARENHLRQFLDHLYRPNPDLIVPKDEKTIVCRCEEVTAGQIREAIESGLLNPNQVKAHTRCGMGPCQGRMCGLTLSEMIAEYGFVNIAEVDYFRIRPPIKPITVAQLSDIQLTDPLEERHEIR